MKERCLEEKLAVDLKWAKGLKETDEVAVIAISEQKGKIMK